VLLAVVTVKPTRFNAIIVPNNIKIMHTDSGQTEFHINTTLLASRGLHNHQWRRQDLLRGGAKLEIMSWGTHGELQGRLQQLLDD